MAEGTGAAEGGAVASAGVREPEADSRSASSALDQSPVLERILARLAAIEGELAAHSRRAAHREAVIDRLHAENQELRGGLRRTILDPAVGDLIRLHDTLTREARRIEEQAAGGAAEASTGLIRSFASDVELILDRCGVEPFFAEPGDRFRPGEHHAVSVLPTDEPLLDGTLAEVVAPGFREREQGRVRRPLQARFHQYRPGAEKAGGPEPAPTGELT
jgi:molecular chaperone GrpE (heat shock protein)